MLGTQEQTKPIKSLTSRSLRPAGKTDTQGSKQTMVADLGTGCSETLEQGGLVWPAEERKDSLRETGRMSGVNWMVRGLPGGPVQARGTAYAKAYAK